MTWLFPRFLAAVLALAAGALVGFLAGGLLHASQGGAIVGAAIGIAVVGIVDALRGQRLLQWLRGAQEREAPRDTGFWGEVGYRVERSMRERERSASQERERNRQFLSAMDASPNGVILLDAADRIGWCNLAAASHFGLDPVRDLLQRVTNLVRHPAFVACMQAQQFDEPLKLDYAGRPTLSVLVRPFGDGQKLVLSQDITERERSEVMRRDFVANVSHEIRTPLTVLAGFVETMSTLALTEAERARVLTLMRAQTDRMQALVADLLTLAQLEGSPRPSTERWQPLAPIIMQVATDARALSAGRHELVLPAQVDAELCGNGAELQSALANLVNNAVRYTPEGGRIELRWQVRDDGVGELDVIDNGIGIAREHMSRLSERFYRVDGSRSRDTGGTGLGLAIVKHVVQRHGGELAIASESGRGSRFGLVLPAARVRTPAG